MTVNSASIGADWFLNGLADLQARQLQTQKELSSGIRVSSAADDPSATHALVNLGSALATAQTYQTNLGNVQAEASAADTAIGSAIGLIQSAQSLATRGASTTTTAAERQSFAAAVQTIQQQLVALANTNVGGRFIFGGDQDQSAPYQYNAASATGVDALTAAPATRTIVNPGAQTVYQSSTAGTIFDASGNSAFAALQSLQTALQNNDPAGVAGVLSSLGSVASWLNQQQAAYGSSEQRLAAEQNSVGTQITSIQTSIGSLRDANIAQDATDLTQESTSQQAALAAQAAIPRKSLFDYLG